LMPVVFDARDRWERIIPTGQLNRWIRDVRHGMSPPTVSGKPVKVKYILQTKGRPPTFLLYCSTDKIPENYSKFIMKNFQDTFMMYGMEVRLIVKKSAPENPYDTGKKRKGFGLGGHEGRKKRKMEHVRRLLDGTKTKEEYIAKMAALPSWKRRQLKDRRMKRR